jgi:hypothetical protein
MKANQLSKLNNKGYTQVVGGIVALLIAIVIGVMLYFEVTESTEAFEESTIDYITSDIDGTAFTVWDLATGGSNFTGVTIELDYNIHSISNITCWNESGSDEVESYLETEGTHYSVNGDRLRIAAGQASNFTQVNVTWVSQIGSATGTNTDMATTVFGLLPLVALVVVAAILLGIVLVFGKRRGGGI